MVQNSSVQRSRQITTLAQVGQVISSGKILDEILQLVVRMISEMMQARPVQAALASAASFAAGALLPLAAAAQEYPSKPITAIIPFAPGNANDITARIVLEQMGKQMGWTDDGKGFVTGHTGLTAMSEWPEFREMIGGDFEKGLTQLKATVESGSGK